MVIRGLLDIPNHRMAEISPSLIFFDHPNSIKEFDHQS